MEEGQINCLLRQILQNLLHILWALLPNYFVALHKILATFNKTAKDNVQCTRSCNIFTILLHVKCLQCFATYLKYNSLYKLHVIK